MENKYTSRRGLKLFLIVFVVFIGLGLFVSNVLGFKLFDFEEKIAREIAKSAGYDIDELEKAGKDSTINIDLNDLLESKLPTEKEENLNVNEIINEAVNDIIDEVKTNEDSSIMGYSKKGDINPDLPGYYEAVKVEVEDENGEVETTLKDELNTYKDYGIGVYFEANEDNTAVFSMFGVKINLNILDS